MDFVEQKRANFARFIRENTLRNKDQIEICVQSMLEVDPALFLKLILALDPNPETALKSLLELAGCAECDFNPDAKPKAFLYFEMFREIAGAK